MFAIIILFTADIYSLLIYRSTLHSALQPVATSACLSQSCSGYGMRVTKFLHNVAITECKKLAIQKHVKWRERISIIITHITILNSFHISTIPTVLIDMTALYICTNLSCRC